MTTLPELLDSFTSYAWRLEALDTYDIGDERGQFEDFLAGRTPQPSQDDLEWQERARKVVASGRSIGRVRMVGHPITDYTRFEWTAYPDNITAGEEVRVFDRTWPGGTDPRFKQDVWIFDDHVAAVMRYTSSGEVLEPTITEDVAPYLEMKRAALAGSVPFDAYTLPSDQVPESDGSYEESARGAH